MVERIVFLVGEWSVAGESIVRTMPVVLESLGSFLENLTAALWAQDVVAKAKVLVQEERGLRNPLVAVLALNFVGAMLDGIYAVGIVGWGRRGVIDGDTEFILFGGGGG